MGRLGYLLFVALTAFCWGIYGPVLHQGQERLGADGQNSTLRSLICVGVAYFLIAVVVPIVILTRKGEKGHWSISGFVWSFAAGAIGALGALGIILAFKFDGTPVFVMPLVFGCAPVTNTIVTMLMNRTTGKASVIFYVGIFIVALGAVGVLRFKPRATLHSQPSTQSLEQEKPEIDQKNSSENSSESTVTSPTSAPPKGPNLVNLLFVLMTALCWGAYGPVLHTGQSRMNGSRLRPFLCVGLAYFAIAVVVPYFLLLRFPEPGSWGQIDGVFWSLMGGTAGALGALGIIYAFNFGGKPLSVMPLVFGGAPVVNTFTETLANGLWDKVSVSFLLSLLVVILGAITVLIAAPRAVPTSKPKDSIPANHS